MNSTTPIEATIAPAAGQSLHNRGLTGRGVGIAVIDSGVTAPEEFGDRLVVGPDFTVDGATEDHGRDRTGHGTHLAGLAAGARTGVAPGAHVVNLKVAGEGGATDPMAVIAAIDWAVANRRQLQLGVILLAFGAEQFASGRDPLAEAVTRAWKAGLVVVTSAGNEGDAPLPTPAHIAEVLTVGAGELVDGSWQRCDFSNTGRDGRRADLLAPGRSVVGPVAHGAVEAPESSFVGPDHVKGSGSSQAAAVAAGAVALLLEADGSLTPDEVKQILCTSAIRVDDLAAGAGAMDLELAVALLASGLFRDAAPQSLTAAGARAWKGLEWSGLRWAGLRWAGLEWSGLRWAGLEWSGLRWAGLEWSGLRWAGLRWAGLEWSGLRWAGLEWSGLRWAGLEWSGLRWAGLRWAGLEWSGLRWAGLEWSGLRWAGLEWSGLRWAGLEWSGLRWAGLRWAGLEWSGLRWAGLEWSGLRWAGLRWAGLEWSGLRWAGLEWSGLRWAGLRWAGLEWSGLRWA